jgi:hypothetical protein
VSDPRQPDWSDPTQAANGYQPPVDPAYSGQYPGQYWGPPPYPPTGYTGPMTQPTEQLPTYWQPSQGFPPQQPPPPPPRPPRSPRWLWIAAAAAVLLVAGLVLALVIVSSSSKDSTVVAPLPPTATSPTVRPVPPAITRAPIPTTTRPPLTTTTVRPQPTTTAEPTTPVLPGETTAPGTTETVIYSVSGEGRAINITYVDTGGVMQTEFNVQLPWSKEVSLAAPAKNSASVAVVNVGRDVTCSVSVNGAQVRQRSGRGLTICTGIA